MATFCTELRICISWFTAFTTELWLWTRQATFCTELSIFQYLSTTFTGCTRKVTSQVTCRLLRLDINNWSWYWDYIRESWISRKHSGSWCNDNRRCHTMWALAVNLILFSLLFLVFSLYLFIMLFLILKHSLFVKLLDMSFQAVSALWRNLLVWDKMHQISVWSWLLRNWSLALKAEAWFIQKLYAEEPSSDVLEFIYFVEVKSRLPNLSLFVVYDICIIWLVFGWE